MASFKGLAHRLEYVTTKDGVDYYNDSISTIPEAAIAALGSIAHAKTISTRLSRASRKPSKAPWLLRRVVS